MQIFFSFQRVRNYGSRFFFFFFLPFSLFLLFIGTSQRKLSHILWGSKLPKIGVFIVRAINFDDHIIVGTWGSAWSSFHWKSSVFSFYNNNKKIMILRSPSFYIDHVHISHLSNFNVSIHHGWVESLYIIFWVYI